MNLNDRLAALAAETQYLEAFKDNPCYLPIDRSFGPEVEIGGKRYIRLGASDYLGLAHDPRVLEAAAEAVRKWGAGPGGSRFLCGNMTLHEQLEDRIAAFLGKKRAVVHTTGFLAYLGSMANISNPGDVFLVDSGVHPLLHEACRATRMPVYPYEHEDVSSAVAQYEKLRQERPDSYIFLVLEGVYAVSGEISKALPALVDLCAKDPKLGMYLVDSYGVGIMGKGGRGTANSLGLENGVDFTAGSFGNAFGASGGFVASDLEDVSVFIKHQSRSLIFSAALPSCNSATVLKSLDILEQEPERVERLMAVSGRVRAEYEKMGLITAKSDSHILSVYLGSEQTAHEFTSDLFEQGILVPLLLYPQVPKGRAMIHTSFMSAHEDGQVDFVLEQMDRLAEKHGVRRQDIEEDGTVLDFMFKTDPVAREACSAS